MNLIYDPNDYEYEDGFFADFRYWVRAKNRKNGVSIVSDAPSLCKQKWEYFVEAENGDYVSIYDNKKFAKFEGSSKEAKSYGCVAQVSPLDSTIRDFYRGRSNQNPLIWYLDIETRVGTVAAGFPSPDKALEPVCLIQILDGHSQKVHIFGLMDFHHSDWYLKQPDHLGKEVVYTKCNDEKDLFHRFFDLLETRCPAVVFAWNGEGFDFPYLYNRCVRIGMDEVKFCPFWRTFGLGAAESKGIVKLQEVESAGFGDRKDYKLQVAGCVYMDIKRLYQKIILSPRTSYSLNNIATVELGTRKIQHDEFQTFDDFYQGNYTLPENPSEDQKLTLCYQLAISGKPEIEIRRAGHGQFVYYGIIDVVLLQEIDKKCGLSALMCSISNRLNSKYSTILGTTKSWANYIRNVLHDERKIIIPEVIEKRGADYDKSILGGFVREPERGKQNWVLSADVNSMYPMLSIAGSNISPDTFLFAWELKNEGPEGKLKDFALKTLHVGDKSKEQQESNLLELLKEPQKVELLKSLLKEANLVMAPNGVFFRKDTKGVVPGLVAEIYAERKKVKKAMFVKDQRIIEIEQILKGRRQ